MEQENSSVQSYIRTAVSQGKSHEEIANNLRAAGWREEVIDHGFAAVASGAVSTQSARQKRELEDPRVTFLYILSFLTLYISVWAFIATAFGTVDSIFVGLTSGARETFRWAIAALVIVFPVFLIVNHFIEKVVSKSAGDLHMTQTRRSFTYFTLFIAAITLIISAVGLVYQLTGGEVIIQAVLKILAVVFAAGALFGYYFNDVRKNKVKSEN